VFEVTMMDTVFEIFETEKQVLETRHQIFTGP
jgi:hypothetical protein